MNMKTNKQIDKDLTKGKALKLLHISQPNWEHKPIITTGNFLKAFNEYKYNEKGYIRSRDLENFVYTLFDNFDKNEVDIAALKEYIHSVIFYYEHIKQRWIAMLDLYSTLKEILVESFMKNFLGRVKYSSVDIMQIWKHYNADDTMTLDDEEYEIFIFDLLLSQKEKCTPAITKALKARMIELSGEEELSLRGLSQMLPMEPIILDQYEDIQSLKDEEKERILQFYDQNDEGEIDGCELYALIKDIFEKNEYSDPYNIEMIHEAINFLQQEGGIKPNGALDKNCLDILFKLGLNETTL